MGLRLFISDFRFESELWSPDRKGHFTRTYLSWNELVSLFNRIISILFVKVNALNSLVLYLL